jgi:cell wall-associated protease
MRTLLPRALVLVAALGLSYPVVSHLVPNVAFAATVAIIDSGVDIKHPVLESSIWVNSQETAGNKVDDDKNGYVDDVNGWNLAENNNKLIDYAYLNRITPDNLRFFELQKKSLEGTITEDEKAWIKKQLADEKFLKGLQTFGNFVHGTHVAGIASSQGKSGVEILGVKLLPTEVKLPGSKGVMGKDPFASVKAPGPNLGDFVKDFLFKQLLIQLAKAQGQIFATVGTYMNSTEANVANLSLGTSTTAAKSIVELLGKIFFPKKPPSEEKIQQYAAGFVQAMVIETSQMAKVAPKTLFVIAAGNDGTNNDEQPVAPANIGQPNSISVAATMQDQSLAKFSNFGEKMVDVAAPGVGIVSTIPGGGEMALSGTSQASPQVAEVAGAVVKEDPSLSPEQVKEILMKTSDDKSFLKGKVRSGGIVNGQRALDAAKLTRSGLPLARAIAQARANVSDMVYASDVNSFEASETSEVFALPLPSTF